jgi:hypothetical protein
MTALCPGCAAPCRRGRGCASCEARALDSIDPWRVPHPLSLGQLLRAIRRAMRGPPGSVDPAAVGLGLRAP